MTYILQRRQEQPNDDVTEEGLQVEKVGRSTDIGLITGESRPFCQHRDDVTDILT